MRCSAARRALTAASSMLSKSGCIAAKSRSPMCSWMAAIMGASRTERSTCARYSQHYQGQSAWIRRSGVGGDRWFGNAVQSDPDGCGLNSGTASCFIRPESSYSRLSPRLALLPRHPQRARAAIPSTLFHTDTQYDPGLEHSAEPPAPASDRGTSGPTRGSRRRGLSGRAIYSARGLLMQAAAVGRPRASGDSS